MPLISSSIPNLINGVSQQPYALRLPSQAEEQINGFSTTANGLLKRSPTNHVKTLQGFPDGDVFVHSINRDLTEQYKVVMSSGDLKVFDIDGIEKAVAFPDGKSYLATAQPSASLTAVTLADYTFILNKEVVVKESTSVSGTRPFEAFVNVKIGNFGKTYAITIDGTVRATNTTPDGSTAAMTAQLSTDFIAAQLCAQLVTAGYAATVTGSLIYITRATNFSISGVDGFNGLAMDVVKNNTQRFSTLPAKLPVDGFLVEIVGDPVSVSDNYWVKYAKGTNDAGVWKETIAPGVSTGLDNSTMPYILVREASGSFTFKRGTWAGRTVGDLKSSPSPSFVNRTMTSIFFYRNRLGFLAQDCLVLTEAGEFFNVFPKTVTTILDSDVIDTTITHPKLPNLIHAIPFDKKLLLFSKLSQFVLESGELLTQKTISTPLVTEYECSEACKPVLAGAALYFPAKLGNHSLMREYYADGTSGQYTAQTISEHVPRLLPKDLTKGTVCSNNDLILFISPSTPNSLFIYKYYWNGQEKLQSSWSTWLLEAGAQILDIDYIDSRVYLVVRRGSEVSLEFMKVNIEGAVSPEPFNICLDRKVLLPKAGHTFADGYTTVAPGYILGNSTHYAVVDEGQPRKAGTLVPVDSAGRIRGDFTNCDLYVGTTYKFVYAFSTIVARVGGNQQGAKADTIAQLQLRYMYLNYADSGYFEVGVQSTGRDPYLYIFAGRVLGLASSTIGKVGIDSGVFKFPVLGKNTEQRIVISSDSALPCSFLSADWEGFYAKRSQGT
jgi:hypothetical protein